MKPGVYLSKQPLPHLDIVSKGDYTNPIAEAFLLKDSQQTITKILEHYIIVYDIKITFFKVKVLGSRLGIRIKLSWDGKNWSDELYYPYEVNAFDSAQQFKIYIGIFFDDYIDLYNPYNITQITDFKIQVIYQ